jgi:4-amino-4-deoxy-L-arabinose transferase-like glycosyltransferase
MMAPRTRRWLAVILLVGAALRIGWCVYAAKPPAGVDARGNFSLHDPNFYMLFGEQFAHGHGYHLPDGTPSAYYPVGYAVALGGMFFVAEHTVGDHPIGAMAAFNVLCGVATVALVFAIGRRLRGDRLGLVAAAITAVYPNLVFHTAAPLTETFFNALVALTVLVALAPDVDTGRVPTRRLAALGGLLGLCILVRPVAMPLVGALFVAWMLAGAGWRRALGQSAAVAAVAVLVVAPWVVRNAVVMHSFTLSTSNGDNLCMSRRVGATGAFEFPNDRCFDGPFRDKKRPEYETEREAQTRRLAVEFVRDHPLEEVKLWCKRLYHAFEHDWDGLDAVQSYGDNAFISPGAERVLELSASTFFFVTLAGALAALPIIVRLRDARWWLVAMVLPATVVIPVIVTFGDPRFHVPALPDLALMTALVVDSLLARGATPASPPRGSPGTG